MVNLSVGDVEGGYSLHVQLLCMLGSCLLSIIGAIEVFAAHTAFGARHVTPNDEVRAACQQSMHDDASDKHFDIHTSNAAWWMALNHH